MENLSKNVWLQQLESCVLKKKAVFENVSLSRRTISERIGDMAENIEGSLKQHIADFCAYSIALDETTNLTNTARLAVLIRGVTENFEMTEELAAVKPMKGKTTGADFMHQLSDVMNNLACDTTMCGITTDGAPAL